MARQELDRQLGELCAAVVHAGVLVDDAVARATEALTRHDTAVTRAVIAGDEEIDAVCARVDAMGACLIARQQPALGDLRAVLAALAIAAEVERMGDHAAGIARLALRLPQAPADSVALGVSALSALVRVQVRGALDAYRAGDTTRAGAIRAADDVVDQLYRGLVHALMEAMADEPTLVLTDTYLLWAAHSLERIGDRAAAICGRVAYVATGGPRAPRLPVPVAS